ncbi:MAG: 8-oxo-dGTP diphosphatase [Ardenticatenaceae bacterium]|nr:8-oxo-dGTP diphosphatase [Ardenticatenaceae bacterium]
MIEATLCFLLAGERVLLGMKKRGLGVGKWNGFGGKVEPGEDVAQTAVRELYEEAGMTVADADLTPMAWLTFNMPTWDMRVHVFVARQWQGEPRESEEMQPRWFNVAEIPYDQMWADDAYWLPYLLREQSVRAYFRYAEDGETVAAWGIEEIGQD